MIFNLYRRVSAPSRPLIRRDVNDVAVQYGDLKNHHTGQIFVPTS